jgi:hypothetical protein
MICLETQAELIDSRPGAQQSEETIFARAFLAQPKAAPSFAGFLALGQDFEIVPHR